MGGIFSAQGPVAAQEGHLIIFAFLLMLAVAIPMLAALYLFAWRYRVGRKTKRGRKAKAVKYDPEHTGSGMNQLLWWIVPGVIIAIISVVNWKTTHALDPYKPLSVPAGSDAQTLNVDVVALTWKWLFIYPQQGIATVNYLEFPADTPVHFYLTADAPMSSFWIPELGSQIYAMAAMRTQLNLMASTTGVFEGKDTEINGDGYAGMTFPVHSVTQDEFNEWVASVKQSPGALTITGYNELMQPSSYDPPVFYGAVDSGLFNYILMKYMMPTSTMSAVTSTVAASTTDVASTTAMPGMDMQNMPGMQM